MPTLAQRQHAHSALTSAPGTARAIREQLRAQLDDIARDDRWSDEHRARLTADARAAATTRTAQFRHEVTAATATLREGAAELDQAAAGTDATARLAAATEQGQAWARLRPQMDNGQHWSALLDQAVTAGDRASVLALADEVPAYVAARQPHRSLSEGGRQPLQLDEVRRGLNAAVARVLGDDKGRGSAARLRAHLDGRGPLAEAELRWTAREADGQQTGIREAVAVQNAQQHADRIAASLDGAPVPAA